MASSGAEDGEVVISTDTATGDLVQVLIGVILCNAPVKELSFICCTLDFIDIVYDWFYYNGKASSHKHTHNTHRHALHTHLHTHTHTHTNPHTLHKYMRCTHINTHTYLFEMILKT